MIGVLAQGHQRAAVEEFFELFKTPWEFYQRDRLYDVVIVTAHDVPPIDVPLLLIYGADSKKTDPAIGVVACSNGACLSCDGLSLPIYGNLLTFAASSDGAIRATTSAGAVGLQFDSGGSTIIRLGYDLFDEVRHLLTVGQPGEHAHVPTLDLHIRMLRNLMIDAGVAFIEVPPSPADYDFTVCLTHDIDFMGIRRHLLDHTMWGFLYRATIGGFWRCVRRRLSVGRLLAAWRAVASLPFVYLGWARDFWDPFRWYLNVEKQLPATYFLIPFKRRAGERVAARHARRRATAYDVTDIPHWVTTLIDHGCEVGVHGIDAWHDVGRGSAELERIADVTGERRVGIRMHWLLRDAATASKLEQAGYSYDATSGYNETVGYRNGTTQAFRPFTANTLLELPLHIQDGALFYPQNLDLPDTEAAMRCRPLIQHVQSSGGVLTLLWHDRSHAPERFWGDFYIDLVQTLRSCNAWFATASQAVDWFRARRRVRFERLDHGDSRIAIHYEGKPVSPPLIVRRHEARSVVDTPWTRTGSLDANPPLRIAS